MATTKYIVGKNAALGLFLRSEPDKTKEANKIAVLPMGTEVTKIANSPVAKWWQVSATISGKVLTGYVNSGYLTAASTATLPADVNTITPVHLTTTSRVTRSNKMWAFPLNESGQPTRSPTASAAAKAQQLTRIVDWLDVENKVRYQPNSKYTYCNIYAYDYCYLGNVYLPRVWWDSKALIDLQARKPVKPIYADTVDEINANGLYRWLKSYGPMFGWQRSADLDEIQNAANNGQVVIICAPNKVPNKSGHICAVVPETANHRAARKGGRVTNPLQSQAGGKNRKYQTDTWWTRLSSTFREYGYWINAA